MKSVQWEQRCSMRTEGWTDRKTDTTKPTDAFRNFANAINSADMSQAK
jgi:hypothetical protein